MANLSTRLDRLVIGFKCGTSWEQMKGDGARRFCDECRREVFDFERMLPAEIRDHLQASRGHLCARLTRQGGRLVTASEVELPQPATPCAPRSAPALTAGLVAVWLSAGAAQAGEPAVATGAPDAPAWEAEREPAPARQATSAPSATLYGRVTAEGGPVDGVAIVARNMLDGRESSTLTGTDGSFTIARLPAGMYEIEGTREGFSIEGQTLAMQSGEQRHAELMAEQAETVHVTLGAVVATAEPLRHAYDASDLVVAAEVGPSVVVERKGVMVEVLTDLHVESLIKGVVARGGVTYRHSEYETGGGEPESWRAELVPGTRVLALLERSKADLGERGRPIFEDVYGVSLKRLADSEGDAYLARLDALARLERKAERRGEMSPADLVEWIVATAEDPLTRGEAIGELESALDALAGSAAKTGDSTESAAEHLALILDRFHDDGGTLRGEPPAALLGAFLTTAHKARLTAALRATDTFGQSDRGLFQIVRRWDEQAADGWLVRQLRVTTPKPAADADQVWWLDRFAQALDDDRLQALVATATDKLEEIGDLGSDESAPEERVRRQEKLAALLADLRRDFAAALAHQRQPRTK